MKDPNLTLRVRGMLANYAMAEAFDEAHDLVEHFGVNGAEDYLKVQIQFVRELRRGEEELAEMEDEYFGDKF